MVNRKDFRPSDSYSSSKKTYNPVRPKKDVVKAFIRGENAHTGNDSLTSDGKTLYSYNTAIAVRQSNGNVIVNNTKYSPTTSRQQSILMGELQQSKTKYDVTGDKDRGYQGEDFSKDNWERMSGGYERNVDTGEVRATSKYGTFSKEHEKEVAKEQSEHPQLSKKQAETIVKQHQEKSPTFTKEEKESLKRFANRKDKSYVEPSTITRENKLNVEKNFRNGYTISDDKGHKETYYGYSKSESVKKFNKEYNKEPQKKLEHTTEKYNNHTIDVYETKSDRGHTEYKVYVDGNFTRTMSTKSNAENYGKTYINAEFKNKPQGRMSLSEIKSENSARGQYFFSPSTMRMYRQVNAKYRVKYDKKTDTNYVIVNMKKYPESSERKEVVYKYNKENGHLDIE